MSASERGDPKAGPFVNLNQAYCNGLDTLAKGYEPVLKGVGRWNLEVMGFMTRRVRAWAEVPARISQCKTPVDLAREQIQFWQTAARDYAEGVQRLTTTLGGLASPGSSAATTPARDYISFPDTKPSAEETPRRERRAA